MISVKLKPKVQNAGSSRQHPSGFYWSFGFIHYHRWLVDKFLVIPPFQFPCGLVVEESLTRKRWKQRDAEFAENVSTASAMGHPVRFRLQGVFPFGSRFPIIFGRTNCGE